MTTEVTMKVETIKEGTPTVKLSSLVQGDFFQFPDRGNYVYQMMKAGYVHLINGEEAYMDGEHDPDVVLMQRARIQVWS